jgi:hypothetical protein
MGSTLHRASEEFSDWMQSIGRASRLGRVAKNGSGSSLMTSSAFSVLKFARLLSACRLVETPVCRHETNADEFICSGHCGAKLSPSTGSNEIRFVLQNALSPRLRVTLFSDHNHASCMLISRASACACKFMLMNPRRLRSLTCDLVIVISSRRKTSLEIFASRCDTFPRPANLRSSF